MNKYELNSEDESMPENEFGYYVNMKEICPGGHYGGREEEWFSAQAVNPAMRMLLRMNAIPASDRYNGRRCTLNGYRFLEDFDEGYANGIEYFDKHFTISTDTLYQNQEKYVSDLNFHFYDAYVDDVMEGWHTIIDEEVDQLDGQTVNRHGFYSAIINSVEDLVYRYPSIFIDFFVKKTISPRIETITEKLKHDLTEHGFFELEKVKVLSPDILKELLGLIAKSKASYKVAMLAYLGFVKHLEKIYPAKVRLHEALSKITGGHSRNIAGQVRTFGPTNEDTRRFQAVQQKAKVESDYQNLLNT